MSSQTEIFSPAAPRRIRATSAVVLMLSAAAAFILTAALAPALDTLKETHPKESAQVVEDWRGNSASIRPWSE